MVFNQCGVTGVQQYWDDLDSSSDNEELVCNENKVEATYS